MGLLGDIFSAIFSSSDSNTNSRDNSIMNKAHEAYKNMSPEEKEAFKKKSLFANEWDD